MSDRPVRLIGALIGVAALLGCGQSAAPQLLRGVVDAEMLPSSNMEVRALTAAAEIAAAALVDSDGRFVLAVSEGTEFRVELVEEGENGLVSVPLILDAGVPAHFRVCTASEPFDLGPVLVGCEAQVPCMRQWMVLDRCAEEKAETCDEIARTIHDCHQAEEQTCSRETEEPFGCLDELGCEPLEEEFWSQCGDPCDEEAQATELSCHVECAGPADVAVAAASLPDSFGCVEEPR